MHFTSAGPLAGTGTTDAEQIVLLMPWMDRVPHFYRGVEMPPNGAAFFGPNAEYAGKCDADHAFTVFIFSAERVNGYLEHTLGPEAIPAPGGYLPVNLPENLRSELESIVTELVDMEGMEDAPFVEENVRIRYEEKILNAIRKMLSLQEQHNLEEMPRHSTQVSTVNKCWALARRETEQNLCLEDLCVEATCSARALQYAFEDISGNSPLAFLRNHRLHKARRMLQGSASSVKEAAYACGFTELGRFSGYYRELFGEKPSETLNPT